VVGHVDHVPLLDHFAIDHRLLQHLELWTPHAQRIQHRLRPRRVDVLPLAAASSHWAGTVEPSRPPSA
jgi:hypothetical protein